MTTRRNPTRAATPTPVRTAHRLLALLACVALLAACGPTDRRDEANPTATISPSPTPTPTPTPTASASPNATTTPQVRQAFVRVVGSAGTPFVGQIIDGSGSRSVDGIVPEDFVLATPRSFISASFSKTEAGLGTITAQIFVDGVLAAEQSTATNFGSVTANATLP